MLMTPPMANRQSAPDIPLSCARYVGRIGALAVALGIGAAIASSPAVAFADPSESDGSATSSDTATSSERGQTSPADAADSVSSEADSSSTPAPTVASQYSPTRGEREPVVPAMAVNSSGGALTSSVRTQDPLLASADDTPHERPSGPGEESTPSVAIKEKVEEQSNSRSDTDSVSKGRGAPQAVSEHAAAPYFADAEGVVTPDEMDLSSAARPVDVASVSFAKLTELSSTTEDPASSAPMSQVREDVGQVTTTVDQASGDVNPAGIREELVSNLLALVGLGASATDAPSAPLEAPIMWAVAALARREVVTTGVREDPPAGIDATTGQLVADESDGDEISGARVTVTAALDSVDWTIVNVVTRNEFGSDPEGVAVSPDGRRIYVASFDRGTVTIIDAATKTVIDADNDLANGADTRIDVGGSATSVAVSRDGTRLYVTNYDDHTVEVFETATNTRVDTIPAGTNPEGVAISPDGLLLYVTNDVRGEGGLSEPPLRGTVTVIDIATHENTSITVGRFPVGVAVSPCGCRIYVVNEADGTMTVINANTLEVLDTVDVGPKPQGVAVSRDGTLYLTDRTNGTLTVIDTANNHVVATIPIPDAEGVAVHPDGNRIYVTSNTGGLYEITLDITPTNRAPEFVSNEQSTDEDTGIVTGQLTYRDPDCDPLTYTGTTATAGSVTVNPDGAYTYIPTDAARHAAAADGENVVRTDSFTITVTDGHGATATVTVTVRITPTNRAPEFVSNEQSTDEDTGIVTGRLTYRDPDGDTLHYTGSTATKGSVTVNPDGAYTYIPTDAARAAAVDPTARTDSFTLTITDGHGFTTNLTITVAIVPPLVPPFVAPPTRDGPALTQPEVLEPGVEPVEPASEPDTSLKHSDVGAPSAVSTPPTQVRAASVGRSQPASAPANVTFEPTTKLPKADSPPPIAGLTSRVGTGTQTMALTMIFLAIGGWFFAHRLTSHIAGG